MHKKTCNLWGVQGSYQIVQGVHSNKDWEPSYALWSVLSDTGTDHPSQHHLHYMYCHVLQKLIKKWTHSLS